MDIFGKPASAEHLIKAFPVCRGMIQMSKPTSTENRIPPVYGLLWVPIFRQLYHCLGALLDLIRSFVFIFQQFNNCTNIIPVSV